MSKRGRMKSAVLLLLSLLLPLLPLSGCSGRGNEGATGKRVLTDAMNAESVGFLIRTVQQKDAKLFAPLKSDADMAVIFQPPNSILVTGTRLLTVDKAEKNKTEKNKTENSKAEKDKSKQKTETGSYTLTVSVENHIARVRVTATTLQGVDIGSGPVQAFDEALSRAFTADALQGIADGGVKSIVIESKYMLIEAETPLR